MKTSLLKIEKVEYVIVEHNLDLPKSMYSVCPPSADKATGQIVGYALFTLPSYEGEIKVLKAMYKALNRIFYQVEKFNPEGFDPFMVMGADLH